MLHLLYILAFTALALLAVVNLIRSMVMLGADVTRTDYDSRPGGTARGNTHTSVSHPEMIDEAGNVIREPLLVMRSMTVDDARDHLKAIYDASPGQTDSSDSAAQ